MCVNYTEGVDMSVNPGVDITLGSKCGMYFSTFRICCF